MRKRLGKPLMRRMKCTSRRTEKLLPLSRKRGNARKPFDLFAWRLREAFVAAALFALAVAPAAAINENAGTKNGAFLKIATDARGMSLGDSVVSMPAGVDSLHWNPAGLALLDSKEAAATHLQYFQDVKIEHVGVGIPMEDSALAVSAFYLSPGDLDGRDLLGNQTGDFKYYNLVGTLGYGRKMLTRAEGADVSIGASIKVVQEKIAEQQFQNPALDLGILASPSDHLNIGVSVRNLSTSKANFSREVVGGASYTLFKVFTGAAALNYSNDALIRASVGGEYRIPDYDTAIRASYQTRDSLDDSEDSAIPFLRQSSLAGIRMGAGFGYRPPVFPGVRLNFDYAMTPFGALGIAHTVTVKVRW